MKPKEFEIPPIMKPLVEEDCRGFSIGECNIFVGTMPNGKKHLSISHPSRYPTWDEIHEARYALLPDDLDMAMYLPKKSDYINVDTNCFHLNECTCYKRG